MILTDHLSTLTGKTTPPTDDSPTFNIGFQFINAAHPSQARGCTAKSAIRSHVARVQHSKGRIQLSTSKISSKVRPKTMVQRTANKVRVRKQSTKKIPKEPETAIEDDEDEVIELPLVQPDSPSKTPPPLERALLISRALKGGRMDPFWTYPVPHQHYVEMIVDHCE